VFRQWVLPMIFLSDTQFSTIPVIIAIVLIQGAGVVLDKIVFGAENNKKTEAYPYADPEPYVENVPDEETELEGFPLPPKND